jgi:hypothetical protein
MKNILLTLFLVLLSIHLHAQTIQITPGPGYVTHCPGEYKNYTATIKDQNGDPISGCTYTWSITNGEFYQGKKTGQTISARWNDVTNLGKLKVTITCGEETYVKEEEYIIRSVKNVSPTNFMMVGGPLEICNSTSTIHVQVNPIYVPNTPSGYTPAYEVDGYEWTLQYPDEWTVVSSYESAWITPKTGCSKGTIRVRGYINSCDGTRHYSNFSSELTLRSLPSYNVKAPNGSNTYTQQCGGGGVTFSVDPISCASTYTWVFPSGWRTDGGADSPVVSPNSSISLVPINSTDGDALKGTVKAIGNLGTCNYEYGTLTIQYSDPPLSTPYFTQNDIYVLCSQSSATTSIHSITDAALYYWYTDTWDSNPTGPVYLNNSSHFQSNPLTTSTPSISISTPTVTNSYGVTLYVRAERANPNCAGSPTRYTRIWAGKPPQVLLPDTYIGPEYAKCVAHNTFADFSADAYSIPGATDVKWRTFPQHSGISLSWLYTGGSINATLYASSSVPTGCYDLIVEAENVCGKADGGAMTNIEIRTPSSSCSGCGGWMMMSIYPNPANDYMEIELTGEGYDEDELDFEYNIEIIDGTGFQRKSLTTNKRLTQIPTSDFPKGIYYIKAYVKDKKVEKRMIIE